MTSNEVAFFLAEVKASEERKQKELIQRNNYPFLIKYYEGQQWPSDEAERKQVKLAVINEYFPNVNALIAEIMYQNPDIITSPLKPQAED
jgi:hypothetical protein